MRFSGKHRYRPNTTSFALSLIVGMVATSCANAATLNLPDTPLFVDGSKTALVQLIVERDNKLFYEAYTSYADLDGDGELDLRYKPGSIDYYGYFYSSFCYSHNGSHFLATSTAIDKKCTSEPSTWSGDFLNYLTMTRMDIMLRALYGGKRLVDTDGQTILRRAFVPWENHTWGIEYFSTAVEGFAIEDYSPLAQPTTGTSHLLATNNWIDMNDTPYLRIRENQDERIWEWTDKERTQGDGDSDSDYVVDVEVCRTGFIEAHCSQYPNGNYKPTGLLHEYGENNQMYFSLLTGSYENNIQGGVLRKAMSSFGDEEIDSSTGIYLRNGGIVSTLDAIQIPNDYDSNNNQSDCPDYWNRDFANGECKAWGNPIAEMMYEGMRYLAGEDEPTSSFETSTGMDATLGLESVEWDKPFDGTHPYAQCAPAYQLVISDPAPSYDGDQLPGSSFASFTDSSLQDLDVGELADTISANETDFPGLKFIGEADGVSDDAPSPKYVTTLKTIRGIAPDAPNRQGSYYSPSVSYFGHQTDLYPLIEGDQTVQNFTLALGSTIPPIEVDVDGRTVTIVPFGRTVWSTFRTRRFATTTYRPTNAIVGFTVEEVSDEYGSFRISFEDMAQGSDNDMDALVRLEYEVDKGEVIVTATSIDGAGGYIQHLGYSISGTSADGVYLVVRDFATAEDRDIDYELDVPDGNSIGDDWDDGEPLPLSSVRRFSPVSTPAAETLESPLWYAAKWGGFDDANEDGIPQTSEWDSNNDGEPDNYFNVTEPSKLEDSLDSLFDSIIEVEADASSVGVSNASLTSNSRIYESEFQSGSWYGSLTSRAIDSDGNLADEIDWDANDRLAIQINKDSRQILTYKPSNGTGIPFRWPADPESPGATELDEIQTEYLSLDPITNVADANGADRLSYVRGNAFEDFRERIEPLGDIVHSSPQLVGPPSFYYADDWGDGEPESSSWYSEFGTDNSTRQRVVYVGANDGMLHAFDAGRYTDDAWTAGSGDELFAYVPSKTYEELPELTSDDYGHKYYVDATPRIGDALIDGDWRTILVSGMGRGGQGIFALDVTAPSAMEEDNASAIVLWEFTDEDDVDLGYTFNSPLIARMQNGKWAAILGNGYNSTQSDDNVSSDGLGTIFIIDLGTGQLIRKLKANTSLDDSTSSEVDVTASSSGIRSPTAVDLDGDNIVDIIYAPDLRGSLVKFDVSSSNSSNWEQIGEELILTEDDNGDALPITSTVTVGSHPTGEGVIIYMGTGKYLEPTDQNDQTTEHRVYALWDKEPFEANNLQSEFEHGEFLQQSITAETSSGTDTDGDGVLDSYVTTRSSTTYDIDWTEHYGWYMDLTYPSVIGEQVIYQPLLREGKLIVSTHIPIGDECTPDEDGWLMILDATSGAMPDASIDIDGDGQFTSADIVSGVKNITNPLASPTLVAAELEDILISDSSDGEGADTTALNIVSRTGRVNWRELEP